MPEELRTCFVEKGKNGIVSYMAAIIEIGYPYRYVG
jgi:hypothetical protein